MSNLPQAFRVIKAMNLDIDRSDSHYRQRGGGELILKGKTIVDGRMQERISWYLDGMARLGEADRQNRYFSDTC
jgi:hypothetical protein